MSRTMNRQSTSATVAGLRDWIRDHDDHVQAAVELIIKHDVWLRRADFTRACVHRDSVTWIDWNAVRLFVDQGAAASASEMAILDLAVALGENRYRLSIMSAAHAPHDRRRSGPRGWGGAVSDEGPTP